MREDRTDAFMASLPRLRRQRSTLEEHELACSKSAKNIRIKFGLEAESSDLIVLPGGERHQLLGELPNTILEIDIGERGCNTEFISESSADVDPNIQHADEVMATTDTVRDAALETDDNIVSITVAAETMTINEDEEHQEFKLFARAPRCVVQSTEPHRLGGVDKLLADYDDPFFISELNDEALKAVQALRAECRGFYEAVVVLHGGGQV